jgi:uncharacterized HAD superfamily protein/adenine/guanine phosphoribosyltransferase-like PRPP-binding protein
LRLWETVCPQGLWTENARWIRTVDRTAAVEKLIAAIPADVTAVAGVPRSGMAAAGQIAEALHIKMCAVHDDTGLIELPSGLRFDGQEPDDGTLLVVDDTVASGLSMCSLRPQLRELSQRRRILTAVVYASPEAAHTVDLYAELLPLPHFLEWNFFNSIHTQSAAFDFDGILCEDCPVEDDDDGPRYARFLDSVRPKYLVRSCEIPLIVTARLEKYREPTEAWLRRYGVRCRQLVMGPWATKDERTRSYDAGAYKGQAYRDSEATIFVESCPIQARAIAEASGKRVICPATAEVFEGEVKEKATISLLASPSTSPMNSLSPSPLPSLPTPLNYDTSAPHLNPEYQSNAPWRWVTTAELIEATRQIMSQVPPVLAGIVGIPRSGMIPASVLATWLHLPLYELAEDGPRRLFHGWRGGQIEAPADAPFLVVDDTVYNGHAMHAARQRMGINPAIYASVYVRPAQTQHVDIYAEILPSPHLLQWNLLNSGMLTGRVQNPHIAGGFALDLDGVICENNPVGDDDPGYEAWLQNARPLWLPRFLPAPLIITYRCKKHRGVTEDWLRRWGCTWERLVMAPFEDWRERDRNLSPVDFKAKHLAESPCVGLVESHDWIARGVQEATGKVVIAVETGVVCQ